MEATDYKNLCQSLKRLPHVRHHNWAALLFVLTGRGNGYFEQMTMDESDSSEQYLLSQVMNLIKTVPNPDAVNDDILIDLILNQWDLFYWHAQAGDLKWCCLDEDYNAFRLRLKNQPNQIVLDQQHAPSEKIISWIQTFIKS